MISDLSSIKATIKTNEKKNYENINNIIYDNNLENTQKKIADAQLDILFFTDINTNITTYLVALGKLAKNQIAFYNNNLASVNLSGIKSIDKYAFENNNLEAIILPGLESKVKEFRARTKEIFGFDEEELDNRNRKYIKKYVDKMRELYMKKLYKNSRKYGLIFEYITYYTYRESYGDMLKEAIALVLP